MHTDDAEALFDYYEREDYGSRAHTLLALAWYTGARLGGLQALDVSDYDSDEQYVQFINRPEPDTPLKNGPDGERAVGLPAHVCDIVDAYLEHNRKPKHDDHGRRPLLSSASGRPADNTVRTWLYLATVPLPALGLPARPRARDLRVRGLLEVEPVSLVAIAPPGADGVDRVATQPGRSGRDG